MAVIELKTFVFPTFKYEGHESIPSKITGLLVMVLDGTFHQTYERGLLLGNSPQHKKKTN